MKTSVGGQPQVKRLINFIDYEAKRVKRERASKGARNKQRSPNQQRMRASGG